MIPVNQITPRIISALDAEGSGRYSFNRDYAPAINYAVEFLVAVFNVAFAQKKLSAESLRELVFQKIWQTSKHSRISFNPADTGGEIWSVLRVSPEPVLDPQISPLTNVTPENSLFVPNVKFVRSKHSASRLTSEEWTDGEDNIFMPGNSVVLNGFKSYAYQDFIVNKPGNIPANIIPEIEIRPYLDNQLVAVQYLVYPTPITLPTDVIMFPKSLTNMVVDKSLNFIARKQGDGTNLYSVTKEEIATLVNVMI